SPQAAYSAPSSAQVLGHRSPSLAVTTVVAGCTVATAKASEAGGPARWPVAAGLRRPSPGTPPNSAWDTIDTPSSSISGECSKGVHRSGPVVVTQVLWRRQHRRSDRDGGAACAAPPRRYVSGCAARGCPRRVCRWWLGNPPLDGTRRAPGDR